MIGFVHGTFKRIDNEAGNTIEYKERSTMNARVMKCSCKLVLPDHAQTEANQVAMGKKEKHVFGTDCT